LICQNSFTRVILTRVCFALSATSCHAPAWHDGAGNRHARVLRARDRPRPEGDTTTQTIRKNSMPLKLSVGIRKKHGLPNYSSVGAGCHIELELDQSLLVDDPEGFHDRVRRTYAACREAVEAELARQLIGDPAVAADGFMSNGHPPDNSSAAGERRTADDKPA
jgi:hypothetical protein